MTPQAPTKLALPEIASVNLDSISKRELTALATSHVADVAENGDDMLSLLAYAAKLEHYAAEIKKAAKERGITDLARYGKGGVSKAGVKLILKESGVRYDYTHDSVWQKRNIDVEAALDLRADWENKLDHVTPGEPIVDPDTGEIYLAQPPLRTGKESITATIL